MTATPQLDVLVCTFGAEGIRRLASMSLPSLPEVRYLVSWQMPPEGWTLPEALRRPDVVVATSATRGLGRNRNLALAMASAPLCLIADDDLRYTPEALREVIATYRRNPDIDMALFRFTPSPKRYPDRVVDLGRRLPKGYFVASVEISFRRDSVVGRVRFPEEFGVGARYPAGEESFFFLDCRRRGLKCRFFPLTVATHCNPDSTGSRPASSGVLRAEGAYLRRAYPITGLPRTFLYALRSRRSGRAPFWRALVNVLRGFFFVRVR